MPEERDWKERQESSMRFIWTVTYFLFSGIWKHMYYVLLAKFLLLACNCIRICISSYFLLPQSLRLPRFCHVMFDLVLYYWCIPSSHYWYISLAHSKMPFGGIVTSENTKFFQNRQWRTGQGTHQYPHTFSTTHLISLISSLSTLQSRFWSPPSPF